MAHVPKGDPVSERITITATAEEVASLQERAGRLTRAEKGRCNMSDFVRNAIAFYCAEQDRCLACRSGVVCQLHGTVALRPAPQKVAEVSAVDIQRVAAVYHGHYAAARGTRPRFGPAEGRAVKSLIMAIGVEQAVACVEHAFADSFWQNKATILSIASDPSRHMGNGSKKTTRASLQADSGYQGGEEKR